MYSIVPTREEGSYYLKARNKNRKLVTHTLDFAWGIMMTSSLSSSTGKRGTRKAGRLGCPYPMPLATRESPSFPFPELSCFLLLYICTVNSCFLSFTASNINESHCTISSLVHQLDIRRALDYDGILGVIGTGLGRATHILLEYNPTYTGGIVCAPRPELNLPSQLSSFIPSKPAILFNPTTEDATVQLLLLPLLPNKER